jgi:hypothetical protein
MVLTLAAAAGIAGHLKLLFDANRATGGHDITTGSRSRFEPLRGALSEMGVRSVGYVGSQAGETASFYYAQVALLPVVVWPDARRPWVVGDAAPAASLAKLNLIEVRNFGNGLRLLRRR